jgi:Mlc titration factor MtfA (ptsG expression regulator)
MAPIIFLLLVALVLAFFCYQYFIRDRWIRSRPFPEAWQAILESALPVYGALTAEQQTRLRQLILLFLAKKRFYGCAGQEMSDEIRVTIAAEACLLILNQGWAVYPGLSAILVYPGGFRIARQQRLEDGTVAMADRHLLGESWSNGRVILSWDDVQRGAANFRDGHNVALHEFAHQLDSASGSSNGAPPLRSNSYRSWARVLSENFEDLRSRLAQGKATVMDGYGTESPAEFFAVATETFFEKPVQLQQHRPELYRELQDYYQLDPRRWMAERGAPEPHRQRSDENPHHGAG